MAGSSCPLHLRVRASSGVFWGRVARVGGSWRRLGRLSAGRVGDSGHGLGRPGLALLGVMLVCAGCGAAAPAQPGPRVSLTLSSPADDARLAGPDVTVSGTVSPARATVEVLGQAVSVDPTGHFSTQIALSVGTNLIDVEAAAPRSSGAVAAVRVIRYLLVAVPSVIGESPGQATAALRALGLRVTVLASTDPLGFLLPTSVRVCSSTPGAGARVQPGSSVILQTSKLCGL
ncbi:PASTA domain-containing protein [Conexibacter sp. DBS9H8]|uniref:PASTA domain-containing protein n=1 Tax=Conexibacter sp. DBS9H8 TaxID=2937801 RepID=UPI0020106F3F|nr:PASTA domain-containing protein [Conexibacter sp. DBS9H8]